MLAQISQKGNQKFIIETQINFYRFNNLLIYIIIIINKILSLLKFRNKIIIKEIIIDNNMIKENKINKRKKNIKNNTSKFLISRLISLIILLNLIFLMKNNILFELINFQYESKITLQIKGSGDKMLFGCETDHIFFSTNYPKKVKINGNLKQPQNYKWNLDKFDNVVELIWDYKINDCRNMFYGHKDITEINFINFDVSEVTDMSFMFAECSSLTSLKLSIFDTSKVANMLFMFKGCSALTSLNLYNFDTSQVTDMRYMFQGCSLLTSLNLSNFNTLKLERISNMFSDCENLEYINMKNFDESQLDNDEKYYEEIFTNVPENVVICIKESKTRLKIYPQITSKNCYVIDCTDDWKSNQKKIVIDSDNICYKNCADLPVYKYEYNGKCLKDCTKGLLFDNNNNQINKCKCELDECLLCPKVALKKKLCTKCNTNYYSKDNDFSNFGEYIKCYEKEDVIEDNLYEQCYYTCKTCNISGNNISHNCIECNDNYPNKIKNKNYLNCYENCIYYYYFDDKNNYYCTKSSSCPIGYLKSNDYTKKCIKYDIKSNIEEFVLNERNKSEIMSKEEEIEYYNNIINIIEKGFTENYDTSELDNGKDAYFITEKMIWILSTLQNQKGNMNNNMTTIDLGECETLLRKEYNITNNETLYIKIINVHQDEMETSKVEYDVYCKLFGTNLIKLNLTVCLNSKILIYIPFNMTEKEEKYNSNSGYYNDICYTTTSEDGTDITLKDRQNDYIYKNRIVCQEDCIFSKYDYNTFKAICSCDVKESPSSIVDMMNIDKMKIALKNFKNIKNYANINFLVCYKKLLNKNGLINNIGSYLLLAIILFHIITVIIFFENQFSSIKMKIKKIIFEKNKSKLINKDKYRKKKKLNSRIKKHSISTEKSVIKKLIRVKKISKKKLNKKNKLHNYKYSKNNYQINIQNNNIIKKINSNKILNRQNTNKNKKAENRMKYTDQEINELPYNLAIQYDKRTFCNYYISLLKTKHNLIFTFFNNDYNSTIIKIDLFFIGFTIDYIVNALFYDDNTMHNIYENKGQFKLETQIPIIAYSALISMVLNTLLGLLALSNDEIIKFKQSNLKNNLMKREENLKFKLTIKFILYFIISFLLLIFFWYYISIFCVIYKNTQVHLLKDTLMSFVLLLFTPFVIYLFPGFFRIPALSDNNKRKYLYNFSKFLQIF